MDEERRRYFRINELVGLSVRLLDSQHEEQFDGESARDLLSLVSQQDEKIESLLRKLEDESPQVSEVLSLLNQKIERVSRVLAMDVIRGRLNQCF
jgi:predicted nuclease with TOPRIM domain